MKSFVLLFVCISLSFTQQWYTGKAVAVGGEDVPIVKLRQQALTKARLNALEQAGVSISAKTTSIKGEQGENLIDIYGAFAESESRGIIVEEKNVKYSAAIKDEQNGSVVMVASSLDAKVEIPEGKPDYTFDVKINSSKQFYYEGENLQLSVISTKDGYVNIFQIKNDSCFILHPHPLLPVTKNNFLKANTDLFIPPKDNPYSFELNLEGGDGKTATEFIVAVVTKDDYPIGGKNNHNEFFTLQEYNQWLLNIPLDKRSSASAIVNIVRK
jgi:hypothetical protein